MRTRIGRGQIETGTPAQGVIAWQLRQLDERTIARWTEATMHRNEMLSTVDLAKRPDTLDRLSRLFDV